MRPITTLPDARDLITSMSMRYPDKLAGRIGYGDDRQANIDLVFDRMRGCLPLIEKRVKDPVIMQKLERYLEKSRTAYKAGENETGDRNFIMFEATAFPENYKGATLPANWDW